MVRLYNKRHVSFLLLICLLLQMCIPTLAVAEVLNYSGNEINATYGIKNDTEVSILEDVELKCMHGKAQGEKCFYCGELVHSIKNIPLVGCAEDFFNSVKPPANCDEEDLLRYNMKNIRLVCEHIVADGLYCEQCGHIVDIQPDDYIDCAIFDSCIHGKIIGEKCEDCKNLKIEQGDYELLEGEEWDDPLVYPTETLIDGRFALRCEVDTIGYKHYYCPWCNYEFGDNMIWTLNVRYHGNYNNSPCKGWSKPALYVMLTGTCRDHSSKQIYQCGHVDSGWFSHQYYTPLHNYVNIGEDIEQVKASCKQSGKLITTERLRCSICGNIKSGNRSSETTNQLAHNYTSFIYNNANQHKANCSGINTASHSDLYNHKFVQTGDDWFCEKHEQGCDAFKTVVYLDAYTIVDGTETLLKENLVKTLSGVYSASKLNNIIKAEQLLGKCMNEFNIGDTKYAICDVQTSQTGIVPGGVRLKIYYDEVVDKADYTVKHYKETGFETGEYDLADTETGQFAIGSMFEAGFKNYSGFKPVDNQTKTLVISEEADLNVIELYYNARQMPFQDEFSFWVPERIYINVDKDGNTKILGEPSAINAAQKRSVAVKSISLRAFDDWSFVDNAEMLEDESTGVKKLAVSINGDNAVASGNTAMLNLTPERWIIAADTALPLNISIVAAKQIQNINQEYVFSIDFVADWSENDPPELTEHRITLVDAEGGKIDNDANKQLFSVNEQIPELPKCDADYLYKHTGWRVAGTDMKIHSGDVINDDITLEPVYELRGKVVDLYIYPNSGEYGIVSINEVKAVIGDTWGEVKNQYNIIPTPAVDCSFKGYTTELEDVLGYLDDGYTINQSQVLTACFDSLNKQYYINVLPPDSHGVVHNGVTRMITDGNGVLTSLPKIDADKYYELDKWVNVVDNSEVTVGMVLNQDITIKPIMKLKDDILTIRIDADFYANLDSYSSVYVESGTTWGEVVKPAATPVNGYFLTGWYNGNTLLTDDYVITNSFTAKMGAAKDMSSYFNFTDNGDGTWAVALYMYQKLADEAKNGIIDQLVVPSEYKGKPVTVIKSLFSGSSGFPVKASSIGYSINKLVIPSSIKTINERAFDYNDVIKQFVFSEGLETIGDNAFEANTALTSVSLPKSIVDFGNRAFEDCANITSVYLPAKVLNNASGGNLFYGCDGIRSWTAPEGTIRIPGGLFSGCDYLSDVKLVDSIDVIEGSAFSDCIRLKSIELPANLTKLAGFSRSGLVDITIPGTVKEVVGFEGCTSLKTVTMQEGVETIGRFAFNGCTALKTGVSIPSTVKTIRGSAFGYCSNIFLEVPDTVETIEQMAFWNAYHIYYNGSSSDPANDNWGAKYRN